MREKSLTGMDWKTAPIGATHTNGHHWFVVELEHNSFRSLLYPVPKVIKMYEHDKLFDITDVENLQLSDLTSKELDLGLVSVLSSNIDWTMAPEGTTGFCVITLLWLQQNENGLFAFSDKFATWVKVNTELGIFKVMEIYYKPSTNLYPHIKAGTFLIVAIPGRERQKIVVVHRNHKELETAFIECTPSKFKTIDLYEATYLNYVTYSDRIDGVYQSILRVLNPHVVEGSSNDPASTMLFPYLKKGMFISTKVSEPLDPDNVVLDAVIIHRDDRYITVAAMNPAEFTESVIDLSTIRADLYPICSVLFCSTTWN